MPRWTLPLSLLLVATLPTHADDAPPANMQPPVLAPSTEVLLTQQDEKSWKKERRAWIEEMHRAAPGTDWRAIEVQNGLRRMELHRSAQVEARGTTPWSQVGSRNLAGRMYRSALSVDGTQMYCGSDLGGIWRADLNGVGWEPLSDNLFGGTHDLAIAAGTPNVITRSTNTGLIHYSDDDGATWQTPVGLPGNIRRVFRTMTDPADASRVYLLLEKTDSRQELFLSTDSGRTYTEIRDTGLAEADFWMDRQVGGRVYLLEGTSFSKTDNQGATWDPIAATGLPNPQQLYLAGSEAGGPTFYVAQRTATTWRLYRSTDGGLTWAFRHNIGDFYAMWGAVQSSILNEDVVMYGGVNLSRSTDGGSTFQVVNNWPEYYDDIVNKLHADIPGVSVIWDGANEIHYVGTDGGVYRSDDAVATVTNISLEFLGVSQYYSTLTSVNDPTLILAGSQDQGFQRSFGPAMGTWRDFDQLISGDFGHLTSGDGTHDWVFATYPALMLAQEGELSPTIHIFNFPGGANRSAWLPYVLADPNNNENFYFCGDRLYYYDKDPGGGSPTWSISASAQDFAIGSSRYLSALGISPVDDTQRAGITDSGVIWYSTDSGANWIQSVSTGPEETFLYGTALEFSGNNVNEAWIGGSGYTGPAAYHSTDAGVTWTAASTGLPATLIYDLAYESPTSDVVYASTEAGPYRYDPNLNLWEYIGQGAPLTWFWSVEAVPAAGLMRYGTYGRGIWDYQTNAATSVDELAGAARPGDPLTNYPNPFAGETTFRFASRRAGAATLAIFDVTGRAVRRLYDDRSLAGTRTIAWDGRDDLGQRLSPGVYFARLQHADGVESRRVTITD